MAKILGVRSYRPFDVYDSFCPTKIEPAGQLLFGDANIGNQTLSTMQVPRQLLSDQSALIANMYARTNIPIAIGDACAHAFNEFAQTTTVTLVVGGRPQALLPLSVLLSRWHGDIRELKVGEGRESAILELAQRMRAAWTPESEMTWEEIGTDDQDRWLTAARVAYQAIGASPIAFVPVRQCVHVRVDVNAHAAAKLRELTPKTIAPMPLVWIHLEGVGRHERG